jgi:hypothetical protein
VPIKPIFSRYDYELERWQWGLAPEDFKKVTEGYACSRCLEEWEIWRPACPVCKEPVALPDIFTPPREWVEH